MHIIIAHKRGECQAADVLFGVLPTGLSSDNAGNMCCAGLLVFISRKSTISVGKVFNMDRHIIVGALNDECGVGSRADPRG